MKKNEVLFSKLMTAVAVFGSLFLIPDFADAATRGSTRSIASSRKNISTTTQTETQTQTQTTETTKTETTTKKTSVKTQTSQPELIISNKSGQFEDMISDIMESASPDNSFAEQIRKQRAALAASEASLLANDAQSKALSTNSSSCDVALRKCMMETCGKDFTKCATDGDTMFGEKLNICRTNTECSAQEFNLFSTEIKADRDVNVRLSSYDAVINCGNEYNACIVNECGTTYTKCLGRTAENAAVQKCSIIAKECMEPDSGLAARFSTAIGKLRENAEKDVKTDENRLYTLRDLMSKRCKSLGATFDERSFDCVYSIEFYAGSNQSTPLASRKAYAGDSFICMQEWFGINTTTAQENAYRETRSQTAASSAVLGSGLGTAAGLISSGAIDRALDTQKAKKDYKSECKKQGGKWKNGECTGIKFEDDSETVDEDVEAPVPDTVYETTGTGTSSDETDVEGDTTSGTASDTETTSNTGSSGLNLRTPQLSDLSPDGPITKKDVLDASKRAKKSTRGTTLPSPTASSANTSSNGCTLRFKDGGVVTGIDTIHWWIEKESSVYGRGVDGDKHKYLDSFTIRDSALNITGYRTLANVVSVNSESVNFTKPSEGSTYQMVFKCSKWSNERYIGFVCKHGYDKGKKIGKFNQFSKEERGYDPTNEDDIYDTCIK